MRTSLVSLTDELAAIEDVIESAQLMAELIQNEHLPNMDSRDRAPGLLAAALTAALVAEAAVVESVLMFLGEN
jgi:hypothetical protein